MTYVAVSATHGSISELIGRHIQRADQAIARPTAFRRFLAHWFSAMAVRAQVRLYNELTDAMSDDAIWFKGVELELWRINAESAGADTPFPLSSLTQKIDGLKSKLIESRCRLMEQQRQASRYPVLAQAIADAIVAEVDFFDALEAVKWALIELQASASPLADGYTATTPQGVEALFKRIQHEHGS